MIIQAVVPFRDEQDYLGAMLESVVRQERLPDRLLLVDDGSVDTSPQIATTFVRQYPWAQLQTLPSRSRERDRLSGGSVWRAFLQALGSNHDDYDVLAKIDADLLLPPDFFSHLERQFEKDPRLGIAGAYLKAPDRRGRLSRESHPVFHVRGPTKLYRRACFEEITPVPAILGWDSIDEVKARMRGWKTLSFGIPSDDPVHQRQTGTLDGTLRGFRRHGSAAYAWGAHPVHVLLGTVRRTSEWPWMLGAIHYLAGWVLGALHRLPRAEPEVRAFVRHEEMQRLRTLISQWPGG